jgi:hypothetical protein
VMDMTEALLALSRSTAGAVDLPSTVRWLVALLAPAAKADGRELRLDGSLASLGASSVDSSAARSAIGEALLAAIESGSKVACRANGATLDIFSEDDAPLTPPSSEVVAIVREVGIEIHAEPSALFITFPR